MTRLAQLLTYHMRVGTRAVGPSGAVWSDAAMGTASHCAPNTIRNWRTGRIVPANISHLCDALFGDRDLDARAAFAAAWQEARGLETPPAPPTTESTSGRILRMAVTDARQTPTRPAGTFRITDRLEVDGLVELKAHPTPGNADDTFRLDLTLRFGSLIYDCDETIIDIALTNAEIVIASDAYQFVQGSLVCDRTDHPYLRPRAGCIGVEGPLRRGALHGDPLGTDHLAIMRRTADDEGPITVEVRARAAQVRVATQEQAVSVNRKAIIDAILGEGERKDEFGRLIFARARMSHRATP